MFNADCIYERYMILIRNSDYFPKQYYPVNIYNGDALCFL